MKIFLLTFSIVISIAISQAQKKDTVFNYLGIEIKEPESEFLLFNKKEKAKVKSADFLTQDKIIRLAPELEGYLIEEIDYTIKKEDSVQLETKNIGPVFTEKSLQELSKRSEEHTSEL